MQQPSHRFTTFRRLSVVLFILCALWSYPLLAQQTIQKVTTETPGSLAAELEKLNKPIEALRISGPLNGKDLALLRELAGATMSTLPVESGATDTLTYLDLRKATLHPDAERYAAPDYAQVEANKIGRRMFANCIFLKEIRLPATVTIIDKEAFKGATSLHTVSYIDAVEEIEWGAFEGCTSLYDIELPDGLKVIRGEAFKDCTALRAVVFPSSLVDLGSNAYENTGIRYLNVTIPEDDQAIGNQVFKDCKRLERVSLYGDYLTLKYGLFEGCTALQSVRILSPQVHTIQGSAFQGCTSLVELHLPSSISYIQMDALVGCTALKLLTIPYEGVVMGGMIFEDALAPQITVAVPSTVMADYRAADAWSKCQIADLKDYLSVNAIYLEEDFTALPYSIKEWAGNDTWHTDHGAYINKVGDNQVLKLGDNEGTGHISTKALDLSAHGGHFRIRLAMDGWNPLHSALQVEARDKEGNILSAHRVYCYEPKMGGDLRTFDFEMTGGVQETFIHLYTTEDERIAIVDDVKIYDTDEAIPFYAVDIPELNYGITAVNAEIADTKGLIYGENLTQAPSVKVLSKSLGTFSVDADPTPQGGAMTVFVDTEELGEYSGYIRIKSEDVNVIMLPLEISVRDMDNVYGLDDTNPLDSLQEAFEEGNGIPDNFTTVAIVGKRNWERRYNGDMQHPNRYLSIDGLKSQFDGHTGDIHALIILPALNLSHPDREEWALSFDLAVLRPNGATLHLVSVSKRGEIHRLKDFTADKECEWTPQQVMLSALPDTTAGFLAFEYVGNMPERSTTYRIDNLRYQRITATEDIVSQELRYTTSAGLLSIYGVEQTAIVSIYTTEGLLVTRCSGATQYSVPLVSGYYIVQLGHNTYKVLID